MSNPGEYQPSPAQWVRDQVQAIEESGGTRGLTLRETNLPVVVLTMVGRRTGALRKVPLMRVAHDGVYAAVASRGGAPEHPQWYWTLRDNPRIELRDGTEVSERVAREISGAEREQWWDRCVEAFPPYAEYQARTTRLIPVFLLEPAP
ncbi:MAG: nitroreductase family deazaflavin-dependent oxidoreductase [Frankiaceae bacterium]|jgi:deazaflavin-dependent oxidoreductase (nitroreductase family)|nr:nitroreductase family deazaflavin-dependent oxidoreductase [Frankiaceae bacterium]